MFDADPMAGSTAPGADRDGSAPFTQNTRSLSPLFRQDVTEFPDLIAHAAHARAEPWIAGLSRAMGPVGLVACLFIVGWWGSHLI